MWLFAIGQYEDELDQRAERHAQVCDESRMGDTNGAAGGTKMCARRYAAQHQALAGHDLGALALRPQRRCLRGLPKLHLPEQRRVGLADRQRFGAMLEPQMNAPTEVSLHARDLRKVHDD